MQGRVETSRRFSLQDLQSLAPVTVDTVPTTSHGAQKASFTGVLLWTLIGAAAPVDKPGSRSYLQQTLLAHGRDGYAVALSIGEINPEFDGKQVLIAYAQDGVPLPALRLIVPSDTRAGRSVRDLVSVEIR